MDQDQQGTFESLAGSELDVLAPLNIIRTETVLSKLPVHNLAKKGKIDIRIVKRAAGGDLQLKWEVSYSDRYGQPRQLAYKLDTLVVNRRLDEQERPLPPVIRVGSLKEICKELGLTASGKNTRDLRTAFLQNASAFINAHLTYRGTDGGERRLEAGFTRYGVVFTGEKLPDGRQADAVYVTLNQPYWEVVNTAPLRPLNYDYLRELTPAAQRFYEVASFRVFAALKNHRPQARLLYSDYCAFSAQQRYYDHEHFRVQMYKIHRPHLDSGYLKSVSVEATVDSEGRPDWIMVYTPGPKARAEFVRFTGRPNGYDRLGQLPNDLPQAGVEGREVADPILQCLIERGVAEARAKKLLAAVAVDQRVEDQIEWADLVIRTSTPGTFRNPAGFYCSIIGDNVRPPDGFQSSRRRKAQEKIPGESDTQALELEYEEYRRERVSAHIETMAAEEFHKLVARKRDDYAREYRNLPAETLEEMGITGARAEIERTLQLPSWSDFASGFHSGPKGPKGQEEQKGREGQNVQQTLF